MLAAGRETNTVKYRNKQSSMFHAHTHTHVRAQSCIYQYIHLGGQSISPTRTEHKCAYVQAAHKRVCVQTQELSEIRRGRRLAGGGGVEKGKREMYSRYREADPCLESHTHHSTNSIYEGGLRSNLARGMLMWEKFPLSFSKNKTVPSFQAKNYVI